MLEAIRGKAQGWLAKLILAGITVPFALWGIDSYFRSNPKTQTVAKVGDGGITQQAFSQALKEQSENMRQAMGQNFDPAALETRGFREQILNALAEEEALLQDANEAGLSVSNELIASIIHKIPAFQEDGKFSNERYKRLLEQRGMSIQAFEQQLRRDITLQVYMQPIASSSRVSTTSTDLAAKMAGQRREVSWNEISYASVTEQIKISDQDVQQYFAAHKTDFMEPEAIRFEYAVLSLDGLAKGIQLEEKQVQDYYAQNSSKLGKPEERSASHILIAAAEGDAAARKQAKTKAEGLLDGIKKSPKTFADIAKRESQDPGSANQGGSLGTFGRGMMVKPFENAVYEMKPGELRLVESQFGFHIIRLDGIKSDAPSLAAVRPKIEEELRRQLAQKKFAEAAEDFGNRVYEQASSLKPAADALKLTVQVTDWVTRKGLPGAPLNSPKLLEALFAQDSTKNRQNIEPVEVERSVLVAARVIEHRPAAQMPVQTVSAAIRQKLLQERVTKEAEKIGQGKIGELTQGKEPAGVRWSAFETVWRQQPGSLGSSGLRAVMKANAEKLPAYVGLASNSGYRIIRITRVMDDGADIESLRNVISTGMRQTYSRTDQLAVAELAKARHKIEIAEGVLDRKE